MYRIAALVALLLLLTSCIDNATTVDRLKARVDLVESRLDRIEKKLDSALATNLPAHNPIKSKNKVSKKKEVLTASNYHDVQTYKATKKEPANISWECQAITKKGTRCKRAARSGGYCWQHGG